MSTTLQAHRAHLLGGVSPIALNAGIRPSPKPAVSALRIDQDGRLGQARMIDAQPDFTDGDALHLSDAQPGSIHLRPSLEAERRAVGQDHGAMLVGFDPRGVAQLHTLIDLDPQEAIDTPGNLRRALDLIAESDKGIVRKLHGLVAAGLFNEEAA